MQHKSFNYFKILLKKIFMFVLGDPINYFMFLILLYYYFVKWLLNRAYKVENHTNENVTIQTNVKQ